MLNESNLNNLPQTRFEAELNDSLVNKVQDPRDKMKEDREKLIMTRDEQAQALKDSIQDFKIESQEKNVENARMIGAFRDKIQALHPEVSDKYSLKLDEFDQKNSDMKTKLDEFNLGSRGKWISFKYEYKHDMAALEKYLREFTIEENMTSSVID